MAPCMAHIYYYYVVIVVATAALLLGSVGRFNMFFICFSPSIFPALVYIWKCLWSFAAQYACGEHRACNQTSYCRCLTSISIISVHFFLCARVFHVPLHSSILLFYIFFLWFFFLYGFLPNSMFWHKYPHEKKNSFRAFHFIIIINRLRRKIKIKWESIRLWFSSQSSMHARREEKQNKTTREVHLHTANTLMVGK